MKRKILFFVIILLTLSNFSQNVNMEIHGYSEIVNFPNFKTDQIYSKTKEWIALNYNSANNVIQLDTKEKIIVKGSFSYFSKSLNNDIVFDHTLIISIKDYKSKIEIIIPEKVVSTVIYGESIETNIFEEELRNTITYEVLLNRYIESYKKVYSKKKNFEKKFKKALEKRKITLKETLIFKKELSNNLNHKVREIYNSLKKNILKKEEW